MNPQTLYILWDKPEPEVFAVIGNNYPLSKLAIEDIRSLAKQGYSICLVLSVKHFTIYETELPKIAAKDVSAAIVATLEDQLIQDFSNLHCYFYKITQSVYQVFVCGKSWYEGVGDFWIKNQISFDSITLDWFALKPREVFIFNSGDALIRSDEHNGCLPHKLFLQWIKDKAFEANIYYSQYCLDFPGAVAIDLGWPEWMLSRFLESQPNNIAKRKSHFDVSLYISQEKIHTYAKKIFLGALALVLCVFFTVSVKNLFIFGGNSKVLHGFAKNIHGSLANEITTHLQQQAQKRRFWNTWRALQFAILPNLAIQKIKFHEGAMQIYFEVPSSKMLEQLKSKLAKQRVKILQIQEKNFPNGVRVLMKIQGRS